MSCVQVQHGNADVGDAKATAELNTDQAVCRAACGTDSDLGWVWVATVDAPNQVGPGWRCRGLGDRGLTLIRSEKGAT
jgi:hypothetical protein